MKKFITVLALLSLTACGGSGGGSSKAVNESPEPVDGYFEFVDYECRYLHWYVSGFVYNGQVWLYETLDDCIQYGSDIVNNPNGGFPSQIDLGTPTKVYGELILTYDPNEPSIELNGMQVYVDYQ